MLQRSFLATLQSFEVRNILQKHQKSNTGTSRQSIKFRVKHRGRGGAGPLLKMTGPTRASSLNFPGWIFTYTYLILGAKTVIPIKCVKILESGPRARSQNSCPGRASFKILGPGRANFKNLGPGWQYFFLARAGPGGPTPTSDSES